VPKKCIHILRDVIYVKGVYIFWHPLYISSTNIPSIMIINNIYET